MFGRYILIEVVTPRKRPIVDLAATSNAVARVGFRDVIVKSVGTAILMLGFAFFRQLAAWFLDGVAISGADFSGGPFGPPAAPAQGPRPSLWSAPTPAAQPAAQSSTRASGIDLNEFR